MNDEKIKQIFLLDTVDTGNDIHSSERRPIIGAYSNGKSNTIHDLQYFFHPSPHAGCIWDGNNSGLSWQSNIFTNNFWPLDQAAGRTDALWGKYGNTGKFAGIADRNYLCD